MSDELFQDITEHRNKKLLQSEKKVFREIARANRNSMDVIIDKINKILKNTVSGDGKIYQGDLFKYNREQILRKEIRKILMALGKEEAKLLSGELESMFLDEYAFGLYMLDTVSDGAKIKPLTPNQVKDAMEDKHFGEHFKDTLIRHKLAMADDLFKSIAVLANNNGTTMHQIEKEAKKKIESNVKKTTMIYQTELTRKKTMAGYKAMEASGIQMEGLKWIATLDERTCRECSKYDGKIFNPSTIPVTPPVHPRCRCRMIYPIVGQGDGPRRARDPKTGKNYLTNAKTYEEWKREVGLADKKKADKKVISIEEKRKAKTPTFQKAKNLDEANQFAKKNLGITHADYKDFDLNAANQINQSLYKLKNKFPEIEMDQLMSQKTLQSKLSKEKAKDLEEKFGDSIAWSYRDKDFKGLVFNETKMDAMEKLTERQFKSGYSYKGTADGVDYITNHEFSHQIDYYLREKGIHFRDSDIVSKFEQAQKNYINDHHRYLEKPIGASKEEMKLWRKKGHEETKRLMEEFNGKHLTQYGASNYNEFFAESLAEYMLDKNPREYAREVGKWVEEEFSKLRGEKFTLRED